MDGFNYQSSKELDFLKSIESAVASVPDIKDSDVLNLWLDCMKQTIVNINFTTACVRLILSQKENEK